MTARRTAAAKLAPPITKPRKKVAAAETPAKPRARRSAAVKAETVETTAKPKPAPRKTAAKVNADLKAVESGRKPSGSVVAKVTGADSMQTAAKPTARKTAAKPPAKSASVKRSTETADALPTDAAELRKLLKVARDRRWRAGRRADATTQAEMSELIKRIQAAIKDAK
jgi:hypothetical protein